MAPASEIGSSPLTTADPRAEYVRRAAERRARTDQLAVRWHTIFRLRTFFLGVIVGVAWIFEKERLLHLLLSLPILVFVGAVLAKQRAGRAWQRALDALRFCERRLAVLDDRWAGTGEPGTRFLDDAHPCARDLDLFGPGSLFERLHLAGTPLGEAALADWLRTPAPAPEVRDRQTAVAELRDRLDFREDLAVLGQQAPMRGEVADLLAWARASPPIPGLRRARQAAAAFAGLSALSLLGCLLGFSPVLFLAMLALAGGVALWLRTRARRFLPAGAPGAADLRPLGAILARIGGESFTTPLLCRLQAALAAAHPLRQFVRLRGALPLAPLALPFLGDVQLTLAVEAWRIRHGPALANGLLAVGELEALNALAAHAYENPADPFPELLDVVAMIASGRGFARATYDRKNYAELNKVALSVALQGERLVLFDNVTGAMGDSVLDAILTAVDWQSRILGINKVVSVPLLATWFCTGNNVSLLADTCRRTCHIRLNTDLERPEDRSGFRHPDLLAWVRRERGRLLAAALTLLSAYCKAGRPDQRLTPWGSFPGWSDLIRGAIVWSGLRDPGETRMGLAERADREADSLRALIAGWKEIDPDREGKTVSAVLKTLDAKDAADSYPMLRQALEEAFDIAPGKLPSPQRLGIMLRKFSGRNVEGECFDSRKIHGNVLAWLVRGVGGSGGGAPHRVTRTMLGGLVGPGGLFQAPPRTRE